MVNKTIQKAKVTFAYEPEQEDELKLEVGEIIIITDKNIFEGWMQGEVDGRVGLFPDNFVELLPLETVSVSNDTPKRDNSRNSAKRPVKENPSPEKVDSPPPEKPKLKVLIIISLL